MKSEQIKWDDLTAPFEAKWRIQSTKSGKAVCIPYVDARQVQQRLDDIMGQGNWQNNFDPSTGLATIGLLIDDEWIFKSDIGTDTQVEAIKGRASDAFKRAAVLWGIGRHLYSTGSKTLETNGKQALTAKGEVLWTGDQLTQYLNGISTGRGLIAQLWRACPELQKNEQFVGAMTVLKEVVR
jgi:hypothetical protein